MEVTDNKDLLQAVFDSAANGIAVMRAIRDGKDDVEDFSILLFNAYTLNWIGDVDYKGKRYGDVFPMVKETGILDRFIEVATTGAPAKFESRYTGEGMNHWFHFTAVRQGDLLVVTTEDITARKQAEQALDNALEEKEKQRRIYESITGNTPDLAYVFDLEYRFTYANKALLAMWGKTAEEAIGKGLRENGYEEWHALMHEREIDDIVANKKNIRGTVSFPHAELGSRVYDYILTPVLNDGGEVEAVAGITRDITEFKQTEERLQESEARFRNLLREAPVAATLFQGPELVIEIANELTLKYWGKSESIIGKPVTEAAPELEDQQMIALLQEMYQKGGIVSFAEAPIRFMENGTMKDGFYSFSVKALYDNNGKVESILSTGVDVTEQVLARRKIEESEARLKSVIDQTPAPTLVLRGDDLAIDQINEAMLLLIGRGREIIGMPLITVLPELEGQYVWEQVQKVYKEGMPFDQWEARVPHNRTGVTRDYYYNLAYRPLVEDGTITGMIQVAIDVTEQVMARKRLEESDHDLRNMVLRSPTGICVLDAETLVSEIVNDKFVEIAGKPYEDIMGHWYWDTFAEAAPYFEAALQGVVDKGEAFYVNEAELMLIRHGKEEIIYVTFVYEPLKDADGTVKKVVVWVMENTTQVNERKKVAESERQYKTLSETLEQQVNDRTRELKRSNEDLQQFAHVASHDLKEPVRKIKTFTDRLEKNLAGKLDADGAKYIDRINVATDRMFTMIDGVLAYSTMNAVAQKSEMVDLDEVIKNIETDLEVTLQATGARIESDGLPVLEGAPVLLYQLFYNLINNSIKFVTPGTAPLINITAERISKDGEELARIVLRDNGIGFEAEFAERIFDTFTRLNSKDKYEGTGLGLALCKKIAERHGGSIIATGGTGSGAEFTVLLPMRQKLAVV